MTEILSATIEDPRVQPLLASLEAEYLGRYGESVAADLAAYDGDEFRAPTGTLLVLVAGDETVAGGALRRGADGVGEIKRMWTAPDHRRQGHGARILEALERRAVASGYRSVRLETGSMQTPAIELYRSAGYRRIPSTLRIRAACASRSASDGVVAIDITAPPVSIGSGTGPLHASRTRDRECR